MRETIFRDQNGNLWLMKNYKLFRYMDNDPETIRSLRMENLSGTGLNMTVGNFRKLMFNYLLNDNEPFENWFQLNLGEIFYMPYTEVNMHPVIAIRFLNKFGVKKFNANGVFFVEDVSHWLANSMEQHFQDPNVRRMIRNPKTGIIEWLNQLINFVNSNPTILNPHIVNISYAFRIIEEYQRRLP